MKSQISFLTPAIAGIVIGITSMITQILGTLSQRLAILQSQADSTANAGILEFFGLGVPTYFFQIIVGLYVVQIVFILSMMVNGIQNGADKLNERYVMGNYLVKSSVTYVIVALIIMLLFNIIAGSIIGNLTISAT